MTFGYMELEIELRRGPVGAKFASILLLPMSSTQMSFIVMFLDVFTTYFTFDDFLNFMLVTNMLS